MASSLNTLASSQWDFAFESQPSQLLNGRHILDDVPELITIDRVDRLHLPTNQETTCALDHMETVNVSQPTDTFTSTEMDTNELLDCLDTTRVSESSNTSFKSTVSKRSSKSDALHAFLFPMKGCTPQKSPLRASTQPIQMRKKRRIANDQISMISISTSSSGSSGVFQAISTSYSALKKKRKQSRDDAHDRNRNHNINVNRTRNRKLSPNANTEHNPKHQAEVSVSQRLNSVSVSNQDILTFDSDMMASQNTDCSRLQSLHSLRWPPHIFMGNTAVAIRLKGVYHPASIQVVSNDFFVLKMQTPRTGTIKCVRFKYDDFQRDTDRVISMMDASQLTQTQSQSQRMSCSQSQHRSHYNPMEPLTEDIEVSNSLNHLDSSNISNIDRAHKDISNSESSVDSRDFRETAAPDLICGFPQSVSNLVSPRRHVENSKICDVAFSPSNIPDIVASDDECSIDSRDTTASDLICGSPKHAEHGPDECDDGNEMKEQSSIRSDDAIFVAPPTARGQTHSGSRRRSKRLLNKKTRSRARTEYSHRSASTKKIASHSSDESIGDDEMQQMGIMKHTKITKSKESSKRRSGKRKEYRYWTKEEENAVIGAYKKHRYDKSDDELGTFCDMVADEEFKEIFAVNGRNAAAIRAKWKTLNQKRKLIWKWNREKRRIERERCNASNGKSEDDGSESASNFE